MATFLTPAELCKRWNGAVTTGTLNNWRSQGKGPSYQKISGRSVRYSLESIEEYERQTFHSNDNGTATTKGSAA